MSFSIKPSDGQNNRIDITTNKETLKGVKTYGKKQGEMAKIMGLAQEIRNEDGKLYYVNIRSLGRAWNDANPSSKTLSPQEQLSTPAESASHESPAQESLSPREVTQTKIKESSTIKEYFKERSAKKIAGQNLIPGKTAELEKLNEHLESFMETIATGNEGETVGLFEKNRGLLRADISKLLWNESNIQEVYTSLKTNVLTLDPDHAKQWNDIFKDDKLTKHGKLELFESFRKHISPKLHQKPEAAPTISPTKPSKSDRKEAELVKNDEERNKSLRTNQLINSVIGYFIKRSLIPNIATKRVLDDNQRILNIVSELRWDESNIDEVFDDLAKKIKGINLSEVNAPPTGLEDATKVFDEDLSQAEKLRLILAMKSSAETDNKLRT